MITISDVIHSLLPILGLVFLFLGIKLKRSNYVLLALWVSLVILLLEYKASGGEILGNYFNYFHAIVYSLNLVVLVVCVFYLVLIPLFRAESALLRYGTGFLSLLLIIGLLFLIINLGINAYFIEDRLVNTPILQVATFNKQPYCDYRYIFYKISAENKVKFMCPNHYGLLPSMGELKTTPNFVTKQLPQAVQTKFRQAA